MRNHQTKGESLGELKLSSSLEDYLETIAVLKHQKGAARVRDISELMGVRSSSVNSALATLSKMGLAEHERYGRITLTPEGEKAAAAVQNRHTVLFDFLTSVLNIQPATAQEDACSIEHCVSAETLAKFSRFLEFVKSCSKPDKPECLRMFDRFVETGIRPSCAGN
jgi:DtxR family transcriptional regulator, Mn-dependent transcriptional regulator